MKLILRRTVRDLGQAGQLVEVADAYARNFLLPRGLAVVATKTATAAVAATAAQRATAQAVQKENAAKAKTQLTGAIIRLTGHGHQGGRLYQAIHADQVLQAIADQHGLRLSADVIMEPASIKKAGSQSAMLIWPDRSHVNLTIDVVAEAGATRR